MCFHSDIQSKKNKLYYETQDHQKAYHALGIHAGGLQRPGKHDMHEGLRTRQSHPMQSRFHRLLRWRDLLKVPDRIGQDHD